jgi:hypothetical protein
MASAQRWVRPEVRGDEQVELTEVVAINRNEQQAYFEDGSLVPFSVMYDGYGEITDEPKNAATAVILHPEGPWVVIGLDWFEQMTRH